MRTGLSLRADDLTRLVAAGVLAPSDRVELIDGEVVWMAPIGARHVALVYRLTGLLGRAPGLGVSVQGPLRIDDGTEFSPDLLVTGGAFADEGRVPEPRDAILVVEVADTTLAHDLGTKVPRYAAAGVPEVWVVDVEARMIRTHRDPEGERYRSVGRAVGDEPLAPAGAPSLTVTVETLFRELG